MELKQIKHYISEYIYIIVTKDGWELRDSSDPDPFYTSEDTYITTISNRSITRLIALQSILKDQEA